MKAKRWSVRQSNSFCTHKWLWTSTIYFDGYFISVDNNFKLYKHRSSVIRRCRQVAKLFGIGLPDKPE